MGDLSLTSGLGRSPGEGKGYPAQYCGLENSMDCIVHRVTKSQTQLSDFHILQLAHQDSFFLQLLPVLLLCTRHFPRHWRCRCDKETLRMFWYGECWVDDNKSIRRHLWAINTMRKIKEGNKRGRILTIKKVAALWDLGEKFPGRYSYLPYLAFLKYRCMSDSVLRGH